MTGEILNVTFSSAVAEKGTKEKRKDVVQDP
jgi:hypothetical protein